MLHSEQRYEHTKALQLEHIFSEADRRKLFMGALSRGPETIESSYAFEAVSKAFGGSPKWTQWMGTALHGLKDMRAYNIDKLIAINQSLGQQTSDEPYQNTGYGGWSVKHAASFLGEQPDLHHGYVVDGSGVGYSMVFPKNPITWTDPDRTSCSFLDYKLWGNADHIFKISLDVWFDEPQDHELHRVRFDTAVANLLAAGLPDNLGDRIRQELKKNEAFVLQLGALEAQFGSWSHDHPRETPTQQYGLRLSHVDWRPKIMQKMATLAGMEKTRPTRIGGWQYQAAALRLSLLKLGLS